MKEVIDKDEPPRRKLTRDDWNLMNYVVGSEVKRKR